MQLDLASWLPKHKDSNRNRQIAVSDTRGSESTKRVRPIGDPRFYSARQFRKCKAIFRGVESTFCEIADHLEVSAASMVRLVKVEMHNSGHSDLTRAVAALDLKDNPSVLKQPKNLKIKYEGKMLSVEQISELKGITSTLLLYRLNNGFSVEAAVNESRLDPVFCNRPGKTSAS